MREPVRDKGRLEHIKTAIEHVLDFTVKKPMDDLSENSIEYYGIVKCIEIVGEAAYKLSPMFKDAYADTPWSVIEKMRHVLVHDYYQIDKNEVKYVVEDDLPPLYEQISRYLTETNWEEWEKQKGL
ncbi:MAG: DUF86 domain-containing protein [Bacteroidaceae bacterium]|nr:DUF86 domain-containing protein [Bacteroidaceae bacterium]